MPALLPFRSVTYSGRAGALRDLIYVPGEEPVPAIDQSLLIEDARPALFLYRQRFRFPGETEESVRVGVMGLLDPHEPALIFPHEETYPERVAACADELHTTGLHRSSLFLWSDDAEGAIAPLLKTDAPALMEATDRLGCLHRIWRIADPVLIDKLQAALHPKPLFLADGHHRLAANWKLATIQVRTAALQTLAVHRLLLENDSLTLPETKPIDDVASYWATTPPGFVRFGMVVPGTQLLGFELPCPDGEPNISILQSRILHAVRTRPVRGIARAVEAVRTGQAHMAFLLEPLSVRAIEEDARRGILLPPKSTDFYPKLAAGLVMQRHQNEIVTPATAQRPGVRNPSS